MLILNLLLQNLRLDYGKLKTVYVNCNNYNWLNILTLFETLASIVRKEEHSYCYLGDLNKQTVKAWRALFRWSKLNRYKTAFCLESVLLHLNALQVIYSFLFQATMMTFTRRYGFEVANCGTHTAFQLW